MIDLKKHTPETLRGREVVCPDGLGRVINWNVAGNWVHVQTYAINRDCHWDAANVTLYEPWIPHAKPAHLTGRIRTAIARFELCVRDDDSKGGGHPADILSIERELRNARTELERAIQRRKQIEVE